MQNVYHYQEANCKIVFLSCRTFQIICPTCSVHTDTSNTTQTPGFLLIHMLKDSFFLKKSFLKVDDASETHSFMSMGDLQWPSTSPHQEGSSLVVLFLPHFPCHHLSMGFHVITAPLPGQQMPPGLPIDGTSSIPKQVKGNLFPQSEMASLEGQPHLDKAFALGCLVSGILSSDSWSFWQEEPWVILPSLTTEQSVRTLPDELDPRYELLGETRVFFLRTHKLLHFNS